MALRNHVNGESSGPPLLRKMLLTSATVLAIAPASSFAQNLVLNPGFESSTTCSATAWVSVGTCPITYEYTTGLQHSGTQDLIIGNFGSGIANISQSVNVAAAGKYTFSFWYTVFFPEAGASFNASVGRSAFNISAGSGTPYTQFSQQVTLVPSNSTVTFATASGNSFAVAIDDVSLSFLNSIPLSPFLPANAPTNVVNVSAAIDTYIAANPTVPLPAAFQNLYTLAPDQLRAALTQASGETATGTQQTTFQAMGLFLGVLTDPFMARRGMNDGERAIPFADESGATAYQADGKLRSSSERDAYAAVYKKAPAFAPFEQRWSVWSAGFGGSQTTSGDPSVGSNAATSQIAAMAVGADYLFSPNTIAGFAMAGGGTNFSVANGGGGRSDLFQAGAFIRHSEGPSYISAALAYGWQDISTDRTVVIAGFDDLHAHFDANAYSGRIEGGYRFVTPWMGLTPYAAGQFTTLDLPSYAEQALTGATSFALSYNSKSVTDGRTELGFRTDKSFAMQDSILILRTRLAWAHDYNPDRNAAATFQALPGASFIVNGAALASDSALTSASAELKWKNGWSVAATFEGEFSDVTSSYAGKGVIRRVW
jgi:uncharacterized protein YhjY with autotransporter beta-barrel domain